jgi:hypothetical protein
MQVSRFFAARVFLAGLLLSMSMTSLAAAQTRPVYARPAATMSSFNMEAYFQYVEGLSLQEAVDLDGWTTGLDFTWPFRPNMQLRFLLPIRTEAEAVLIRTGEDIDIEGWGGIFNYATLYFEHQVVGVGEGSNRVSYFAGYGQRTGVLNTGTPDKYNHQGRSLHGGLRYDHDLGGGGLLILDSEIRFYLASDDLHPGDEVDDTFFLGSLKAAWLAGSIGAFTPGVELVADIASGYVAASVVPELILHGSESLDLKLAVPVGISDDAPDWGAQLRMTLSF